ncbi:sigma-70 family RNA polymerase sigma factor [bacterium]|nr:sigma-70 family RNA polymerase sigma factor [bacterium]
MIQNERTFVELIQIRNNEALDYLYTDFMKSLAYLVNKFTRSQDEAKDVYHDLYFKICEATEKFRFECSYKTFISRIAYYYLINRAKKNKKEMPLNLSIAESSAVNVENIIIKKEARKNLEIAFDKLTPDEKILLIMKINLGFKYRELEDILELPMNNIKVKVYRARCKLNKLYTKD